MKKSKMQEELAVRELGVILVVQEMTQMIKIIRS